MTKAEMDELYYLLILAKMKENDRVADVLADVYTMYIQNEKNYTR
jgi:hypothetical protein